MCVNPFDVIHTPVSGDNFGLYLAWGIQSTTHLQYPEISFIVKRGVANISRNE